MCLSWQLKLPLPPGAKGYLIISPRLPFLSPDRAQALGAQVASAGTEGHSCRQSAAMGRCVSKPCLERETLFSC